MVAAGNTPLAVAPSIASGRVRHRWISASLLALVSLGILGSYAPAAVWLVAQWQSQPEYLYGFLVSPLAALVLLRSPRTRAMTRESGRGWAIPGLAGYGVLLGWAYHRQDFYLGSLTVVVAFASLALLAGGWGYLRRVGPVGAFLLLMVPLPPLVTGLGQAWIQQAGVATVVGLLQVCGLPAFSAGNAVILGSVRLVAEQYFPGLSLFMPFVTLFVAAALLATRRCVWERRLLVLGAFPTAFLGAVLRMGLGAVLCRKLGPVEGEYLLTTSQGGLILLSVLAFLSLEFLTLSRLFVPLLNHELLPLERDDAFDEEYFEEETG